MSLIDNFTFVGSISCSFEDTFNYADKNGVRRGYGYELMQALAGYTGWKDNLYF